jgi:non-ribosomal peptide synthetase component F
VGRERPLRLSYAQQRLWFLQQLEPESNSYNCPAAVRLAGRLQVAALEATLGEVLRRHEVLRTHIAVREGEPRQVIEAPARVGLPLVDLSGLAEPERQAQQLAEAEASRPFDLGRGPLLRLWLVRLREEEQVALLTTHHAVCDGWSVGVLVREVAELYRAFSTGATSGLAELAIQYGDYAEWQRAWLEGGELERQLGYWRERLGSGGGALELPTDRVRPAVQSYRGGHEGFVLERELSAGLREVSRGQGATLFVVLLAGLQALLWRSRRSWSRSETSAARPSFK